MSLETWIAFVAASFFICGSPGPNMLHVMASSAAHGMKRALATMAGCITAIFLVLALSAAGLGAVLHASPLLFEALRYAGAGYLFYLGIQAWRAKASALPDTEAADIPPAARPSALYAKGFLVGMSNPKLFLFATAFFPQFINPDAPQLSQFAVLLISFTLVEMGWYAAYGLGGKSLSRAFKRSGVQAAFNRITGGLFMLFSVLLLRYKAQ